MLQTLKSFFSARLVACSSTLDRTPDELCGLYGRQEYHKEKASFGPFYYRFRVSWQHGFCMRRHRRCERERAPWATASRSRPRWSPRAYQQLRTLKATTGRKEGRKEARNEEARERARERPCGSCQGRSPRWHGTIFLL